MGVTVGLLYPGHSAEGDYARLQQLLGPEVSLVVRHTEMRSDAHRVDELSDWGRPDRLARGARTLADSLAPIDLDALVWACTSGSFVFGWDGAQAQADALAAVAKVPATSTSLAFVAAARALGVRRVAVAATYPADVTSLFAALLTDAGLEPLRAASHGILHATEVGTLALGALLEMAAAADHPDAEAVLLPDTALRTVEHVDALERHLGKAVLTANQVSAWAGLRLASHHVTHDHLGCLFRPSAPGTAAAGRGAKGARS